MGRVDREMVPALLDLLFFSVCFTGSSDYGETFRLWGAFSVCGETVLPELPLPTLWLNFLGLIFLDLPSLPVIKGSVSSAGF